MRSETEAFRESFDEMLRSSRFEMVWEIGKGDVPGDDEELVIPFSDKTICLNMTDMTVIISRITTQ